MDNQQLQQDKQRLKQLEQENKELKKANDILCLAAVFLHRRSSTANRNNGLRLYGNDPYIEVISFDKLVNAAKERNRIFFDTLGLPNN